MTIDFLAYLACGFVLFSATTNTVKWFRLASLGSNICFVAYGLHLELLPLLLLHGLLAPMNSMQFLRAWSEDRERRATFVHAK
ncbi:MAG: hypothetical protein AAGA08_19770 [Pseudomonadota bacterium]